MCLSTMGLGGCRGMSENEMEIIQHFIWVIYVCALELAASASIRTQNGNVGDWTNLVFFLVYVGNCCGIDICRSERVGVSKVFARAIEK